MVNRQSQTILISLQIIVEDACTLLFNSRDKRATSFPHEMELNIKQMDRLNIFSIRWVCEAYWNKQQLCKNSNDISCIITLVLHAYRTILSAFGKIMANSIF